MSCLTARLEYKIVQEKRRAAVRRFNSAKRQCRAALERRDIAAAETFVRIMRTEHRIRTGPIEVTGKEVARLVAPNTLRLEGRYCARRPRIVRSTKSK